MHFVDIFPDRVVGLDAALSRGKHQHIPVTIRCHADMVSPFQLKLGQQTLPKDFQVAEMLLIQLMQKQHSVDLKQCYWDWWQKGDAQVEVFVVLRSEIDPVIQQLPPGYLVEAIKPLPVPEVEYA